MKYRRDIDGLRAIAVVPVVVYHVAQAFLRGGYVGVDIFFVISGYLISSNILSQAAESRFSLARFYEHRARRILPAYLVVLAFVTIVVFWKFLPSETRDYGRTLLAAIASVTNIYFWATTDYFTPNADSIPLLHTWSLAVEEQFYLLFPLLAMLLYPRSGGRFRATVAMLFVGSLALSAFGTHIFPIGTFFLLPTRAWELLLGTVLALKMVPAPRTDLQRNLTAAVGLLMILVAVFAYTPATHFPGLAALLPCIGAALIILAGESGETLVSRLLSLRPVVFVGLISYSLYLWHWPLMVFQRTEFLFVATNSKTVARAAVLAASFICATLSWALVERPTRNRKLLSSKMLGYGSAAGAAGLTAAALLVFLGHGFPNRFSPAARDVARYLDYEHGPQYRADTCFLDLHAPFATFDKAACLPDRKDEPTYMLIGDSHAASLIAGLQRAFPQANVLQITGVKCAGLIIPKQDESAACAALTDLALNKLPETRRIAKAWISVRWHPGYLPALLATVEAFHRHHVDAAVIGPNQEYLAALPRILAKAIDTKNANLPRRFLAEEPFRMDRELADFAGKNGIEYVSLIAALCPDRTCVEYAAPGVPLLFDDHHFTDAGSSLVATRIASQLAETPRNVGVNDGPP